MNINFNRPTMYQIQFKPNCVGRFVEVIHKYEFSRRSRIGYGRTPPRDSSIYYVFKLVYGLFVPQRSFSFMGSGGVDRGEGGELEIRRGVPQRSRACAVFIFIINVRHSRTKLLLWECGGARWCSRECVVFIFIMIVCHSHTECLVWERGGVRRRRSRACAVLIFSFLARILSRRCEVHPYCGSLLARQDCMVYHLGCSCLMT
jgi:hypothetical protein